MDPYAILGLLPGCSEVNVKKAYRNLALKHHPDKTGPENAEKMKEINLAYEKLIAIHQREEQQRKEKIQRNNCTGFPFWRPHSNRQPRSGTRCDDTSQNDNFCSESQRPTPSSRFQPGISRNGSEESNTYTSRAGETFQETAKAWRMFDALTHEEAKLNKQEEELNIQYGQPRRPYEELRKQKERLILQQRQLRTRWQEYREKYHPYAKLFSQFRLRQPFNHREAFNVPPDPWQTMQRSGLGGKFRITWSDPDPCGSLASQKPIHQSFRDIMQMFEVYLFGSEPHLFLARISWAVGCVSSKGQAFDAQGEDLLKNLHTSWQNGAAFEELWFEIGRLHHHLKCFKLTHSAFLGRDEVEFMTEAGFAQLALRTGAGQVLLDSRSSSNDMPGRWYSDDTPGTPYMWANAGYFASSREVDEASYRREKGDLPEGWEEFDKEST